MNDEIVGPSDANFDKAKLTAVSVLDIESDPTVCVTLIQADNRLTKSYEFRDGKISSGDAPLLKQGASTTVRLRVSEIAEYIATMNQNQCFMYGTFIGAALDVPRPVVMKHNRRPGAVTRSSEDTEFVSTLNSMESPTSSLHGLRFLSN